MSSYSDWLTGSKLPSYHSGGSPFRLWHSFMDHLYETSHGKARYWLSQLPLTGYVRQADDTARGWQDYYENTGIDPEYSSTYGSFGRGFINDMTGVSGVRHMARSLADMHPPEFFEDCEWHRYRAQRQIGGRNLIGNMRDVDIDMEEY